MGTYTVDYNFTPNDPMWILDNNSVKKGTCIQVEIKIIPSADTVFVTDIKYIALLDCNAGTLLVDESNAYTSLEDAILALQTSVETQTC